jgi:hypothetical protein
MAIRDFEKRERRRHLNAKRDVMRGIPSGKPPRLLKFVSVVGFNAEGDVVGEIKARVKLGSVWVSPKYAKNQLRKQGAVEFTRTNVWE